MPRQRHSSPARRQRHGGAQPRPPCSRPSLGPPDGRARRRRGRRSEHLLPRGSCVSSWRGSARSPLPQWPLLALDDQQRLTGEDEEVLLIGLPVVHRHLFTRLEHGETDSNLREACFAFEAQTLSSPLLVAPAAFTGVQDEPALRSGSKSSCGLLERCLRNHRRIIGGCCTWTRRLHEPRARVS